MDNSIVEPLTVVARKPVVDIVCHEATRCKVERLHAYVYSVQRCGMIWWECRVREVMFAGTGRARTQMYVQQQQQQQQQQQSGVLEEGAGALSYGANETVL